MVFSCVALLIMALTACVCQGSAPEWFEEKMEHLMGLKNGTLRHIGTNFGEKFEKRLSERQMMRNIMREQGGIVDLRVTKGIGKRGYSAVRISLLTVGPVDPTLLEESNITFTYSEPFRYRWTHAFDLGVHAKRCSADSVVAQYNVTNDADCLQACSREPRCQFYTFFEKPKHAKQNANYHHGEHSSFCQLATSNCTMEDDSSASATYENFGQVRLHSGIVHLKPGANHFRVGPKQITIRMPAEGAGTSGIVWSDPCVSSRWINCGLSSEWNLLEESTSLLNAVAQDPDMHFIQILGDNFYDQDGRLTHEVFSRIGDDAKSKFLQVAVGNHDVWVEGGPPGDQAYDQYGYGFMQFYAQDTVASIDHAFGDFSNDPDHLGHASHNNMRNDNSNFLWYHKIGNLGFIGYNGAASLNETIPELEKACAYFKPHWGFPRRKGADYIFLLGHYNEQNEGTVDANMDVPELHKILGGIDGCNIGDRLKYFDGHRHCNYIQEQGKAEPVGFMIGGRGMLDEKCLPQSGFVYIDSSRNSTLKVYYFEEHSVLGARHSEIMECITKHGGKLTSCLHLGSLWLDTKLSKVDSEVEFVSELA